MSEEIREIGLEKESFLLKNGKIMEPKLYGFPRDEFEFLVELRSLPSDRLYPVYTTLQQEELQYKLRANKFGMELKDNPTMIVSREWVDKHWNKYNLHRFDELDYTRNIWNKKEQQSISHHLGVLPGKTPEKRILTSGMHVHFSSRNSKTGEIIELPIEDIVRWMDEEFVFPITEANRNLGEYELKQHGFEYRSLPCNIDVYTVLKESFRILREI